MSTVSIVKCSDYEPTEVDIAVREAIGLLGGIKRYVKPGDRALLKFNLSQNIDYRRRTHRMKLKPRSLLRSFIITLAAIIFIGTTSSCRGAEPQQLQPASGQQIETASPTQQYSVMSAEAYVVPLQEADLAFWAGGRIISLEVEEGDMVTKGQVLAQLDDTTQQAGLAEAEAGTASAEAALAKAGATLAQAQATLDDLKSGAMPEQIAQAEANVARAEAALAELMARPTPEDIAQDEAGVETARASLARVLAGSRDEDIQAAASRLLQAEANVRLAQADYDKYIYGDPDVAEPYGIALQQATLTYEAGQAEYNKLINGATDEEVAVARAQLNEAQMALEKVLAGTTAEQIAQAQAEVRRMEAVLAELEAGATDGQTAVAEAGVEAAKADVQIAQAGTETAEAGLLSAQAELAETELVAPFDSIVGTLFVAMGETVDSGSNVLLLGDASRWRTETDDLTESQVVEVKEGAGVQIRVDALPGEEFEGRVVRITPKSEAKAGDVTYTVLIDFTKGDTSGLRWGMTAFVDIEVGPESQR